MTARRVDPARLVRLIVLYRRGLSARSRRRILGMGANTERTYARLLASANLLAGDHDGVPSVAEVSHAVTIRRPVRRPAQQVSRAEPYRARIAALRASGLSLPQVYGALARENPDLTVSYTSVRRLFEEPAPAAAREEQPATKS